MTPEQARRNARMAGLVTAVVGPALIAAPDRLGRIIEVPNARLLRLIGISDVALAPGLLVAPDRWPWLAARAAADVVVGSRLLLERSWIARSTGVAMLGLAVVDSRAAASVRRAA